MRGLVLVLMVVLPGCIFFDWRGGQWGFTSPSQQVSWTPTPPRPEGSYNPLPVTIPLGRPPDRWLPTAPVPEPEYVPMTVPTEASVWLNGHWRWEDRWYTDGAAWTPASAWIWAEGRWIEKPCAELELAQPEHHATATGTRYLEPHWRCAPAQASCVCPAAEKTRVASTR